jgi:hypothetical protein
MTPGRFRMMAQSNMIRRDCASQKFLLPYDLWLAEKKLLLIVLKERPKVEGCDRGMSLRGVLWIEPFLS